MLFDIYLLPNEILFQFEVIFDGVGINFAASFLHDERAADYITHFVVSDWASDSF